MRLSLLLSVSLILACDRSPEPVADMDPVGRIAGTVTNLTGQPMEGVQVDGAGATVETNGQGAFLLEAVEPADGIVLTYTTSGFATTYGRVDLHGWETATTSATLLEVDGILEMEGSVGGTYHLDTEAGRVDLTFEAGSFLDSAGEAVSGSVIASVTYLDPSSEEFLAGPGDLRGEASEDQQLLVSYGMVEVALQDEDGNTLQIAEGSPATVTIPLVDDDKPDYLQLEAGATQRIWSFDPQQGIWVEEGLGVVVEDTLGNRRIRFEAPHFSWWNADDGRAAYCATGRVVDVLGFPIRGAEVTCVAEVPPFYCAFDGDLTDDCIPPQSSDDKVLADPFSADPFAGEDAVPGDPGADQNWRELSATSRSINVVTTDENGYYSCEVWAGGNAVFQATTFVADLNWFSQVHGQFIAGTTDNINICEPIPTLQIDVCRITGSINVENLSTLVEEGQIEPADNVSALFFDPKGYPEYCDNPWDGVPEGDCITFAAEDIASYLPISAMPGVPADGRSIGSRLTVTSDGVDHDLDRVRIDGSPYYSWDGLKSDNQGDLQTDRPEFNAGDRIDVSTNGDAGDYMGPWSGSRIATVPRALRWTDDSAVTGSTSSGLQVQYDGSNGDSRGAIVMGSSLDAETHMVCRVADNGRIRLTGQQLSRLGVEKATLGVYHIEDGIAVGPDGLPIRLQIFSGATSVVKIQ